VGVEPEVEGWEEDPAAVVDAMERRHGVGRWTRGGRGTMPWVAGLDRGGGGG
jgi:hypothetical protein